ncbi:MAG: PEP-CTERM sorting domain-containing protein [Microcystaceae cyanobacterium]
MQPIVQQRGSILSIKLAQGTTLFGGQGGTVTLATREAQTTPEPSTMLGLGTVMAMAVGTGLKGKFGKAKK